jgi:hypothetical protein
MPKAPIAIDSANPSDTMLSSPRLRLARTYNIECKVKVRNIGTVARENVIRLLRYHQDERDMACEPEDEEKTELLWEQ